MKGIFIALEGPDGSGKSTITKLINAYLNDQDIDFISTREPGGTAIGESIRKMVLDNDNTHMTSKAEALLYAAARAQHVDEKIRPALKEGKLVLCDRFVLSSLAYQGVGRQLGIENVKIINDFAIDEVYPDLILFFYVDPETALLRKTINLNGDRLELEGNIFHERVYKGYMDLIEKYPRNIKTIDARQPVEEVLKASILEIEKILKNKEEER